MILLGAVLGLVWVWLMIEAITKLREKREFEKRAEEIFRIRETNE